LPGRDLEGFFAIDVKSRRDQWRIILEPLDENKEPYVPCNIDEISQYVRIVEIMEVSKHYE
jgi:proteic killer suppression protein